MQVLHRIVNRSLREKESIADIRQAYKTEQIWVDHGRENGMNM